MTDPVPTIEPTLNIVSANSPIVRLRWAVSSPGAPEPPSLVSARITSTGLTLNSCCANAIVISRRSVRRPSIGRGRSLP
jgi:hypothetical protein